MIEVIPAMDIIDGRCVRLEQGDFSRRTEYPGDPVEVAQQFEAAGLERLHMVDLDGARTGKIENLQALEKVVRTTSLKIDFSGGVRTKVDLRAIFETGAEYVSVGSAAVTDRPLVGSWIDAFGPDKFLLGADVRGTKLAVRGWQGQTDVELFDHLRSYLALGIDRVFVTDISRDGLMQGPATDLYQRILSEFPGLRLIASGGVRNTADIDDLDSVGCYGVIIGKALYEGAIKVEELSAYVG